MNAINLIIPYRWEGMWVFDDPRVGLWKEPFVSGADDIIDLMVDRISDADDGFRLIFSGTRFPGADYEFDWLREEAGGHWYHIGSLGREGWLCPALFKYFDKTPPKIYVKVAERRS